MVELSSAAQAVMTACNDAVERLPLSSTKPEQFSIALIAAALRAAADQVVPKSEVMPQRNLESRREAMVWGMVNQTQVTRLQLLAIAAELEAYQ